MLSKAVRNIHILYKLNVFNINEKKKSINSKKEEKKEEKHCYARG